MKNEQINHIYCLKALVDETVSKAFGLSEVAKIARTEKRLRELFFKQWQVAAKRSAKKAGQMAQTRRTPTQIRKEIRKELEKWREAVESIFLDELDYVYRLARIAGYKKATGETDGSLQYDTSQFDIQKASDIPSVSGFSFELIDEEAVKALQGQQVFWIGEFIDEFSAVIEDVSREVIVEVGESPRRAGAVLQERIKESFGDIKIPAGFVGTAERYFEGLTANAVTVARSQGQLASFVAVEAEQFMVVNPMDERTCPRCSVLDGVVFTIDQGVSQMEAEREAGSVDEIKTAHPWLSESKISQINANSTASSLSRNLASAGVVLPPYHFRCRCTIDIV